MLVGILIAYINELDHEEECKKLFAVLVMCLALLMIEKAHGILAAIELRVVYILIGFKAFKRNYKIEIA